jgi:hypothetical protein
MPVSVERVRFQVVVMIRALAGPSEWREQDCIYSGVERGRVDYAASTECIIFGKWDHPAIAEVSSSRR